VPRLVVALLLACGVPAFASDLEVRVFDLHFRAVRDAAVIIEPLLSSEGTILLHPRQNSLTVRDRPEALKRVSEAILRWDMHPASYRLRLSLLLASRLDVATQCRDPLLKEVSEGLQKLFGFHSCEEVDTLRVTAADGNVVESTTGTGEYYVRFLLHASPEDANRVQLSQFEVSRRDGPSGVQTMRPLLSQATVSLLVGQTSILGFSREERAAKALIMVLVAEAGGER
jgi:hypothetical protein